jgi:hypothetical protein
MAKLAVPAEVGVPLSIKTTLLEPKGIIPYPLVKVNPVTPVEL